VHYNLANALVHTRQAARSHCRIPGGPADSTRSSGCPQ
jgi:hypothetical protein